MKPIHGVNMGNWLVLEKWMKPDVFASTNTEDETWLSRKMPPEALKAHLKQHRDTYVTKEDFRRVKEAGLSTIRLPVPYQVFGDRPPLVGCIEYVDLAFDWADRDRTPVLLLADGVIGTMMEPVVLPEPKTEEEVAAIKASKKSWACIGHELDYAHRAWIQPGNWSTLVMQQVNEDAAAMYEAWKQEAMVEEYQTEDAEIILTAYGISGRIAKSAVNLLRAQGIKAGLVRPITVYPFPDAAYDRIDYSKVKAILDVEMSIPALFVEDVKAAVKGRARIETCLCSGGNIMSREAVISAAKKIMEG